ncbi:MAG: hypothetical protein ABSH25_17230 [Syntrophorhabdales bacterium]
MIRFQRTMQFRRGSHAMKWASELTDYVYTTHGGPRMALFRSRFGNISTIYWVGDFDNLAALDAWQQAVGADKGYRELVKKSFAFVIPGSVEDTVLEALP